MTQEEKNLLLRDLCGRLPYGVKCYKMTYKPELAEEVICMLRNSSHNCVQLGTFLYKLEHIKPYLFPLSSMTEEQYKSLEESGILSNCSHSYEYVNPHIHGVSFIFKEFKTYSLELIEWLNKNHFDYRGLIEKGLAIDCTNLNIY